MKNVIFTEESHFGVCKKKSRSFVGHIPSGDDAPFNFQPRVQGGGSSINVWGEGMMTAKKVDPLIFYDGRLDGPTYIKHYQKPFAIMH